MPETKAPARPFLTRLWGVLREALSALREGRLLDFLEQRWVYRFGSRSRLFSYHYEKNTWGSEESVSGPGSTLQYTESIRRELPGLVAELGVSRILDAPCGDYNWFGHIAWRGEIDYIGGDIVEALVERNRSRHGGPRVKFVPLDIVRGPLPAADLWLCRDCLIHLSNREALLAVDAFLRSEIPYLLTATYPECRRNDDIVTGAFRELNLLLPPFGFPPPRRTLEDWIEGYPVRQLGLWKREELRDALASKSR